MHVIVYCTELDDTISLHRAFFKILLQSHLLYSMNQRDPRTNNEDGKDVPKSRDGHQAVVSPPAYSVGLHWNCVGTGILKELC